MLDADKKKKQNKKNILSFLRQTKIIYLLWTQNDEKQNDKRKLWKES